MLSEPHAERELWNTFTNRLVKLAVLCPLHDHDPLRMELMRAGAVYLEPHVVIKWWPSKGSNVAARVSMLEGGV